MVSNQDCFGKPGVVVAREVNNESKVGGNPVRLGENNEGIGN